MVSVQVKTATSIEIPKD